MKILQLANYNGPYEGNFIPSLMALERRLQERGWRQILAFPEGVKEFDWFQRLQREKKCVYIVPGSKLIFSPVKAVDRIVHHEGINVIHTHFTNYDVAAWISKLHSKINHHHVEVIWHVHSPARVKKTFMRRLRDLVKYKIIGRSVHVIVVSGGGFVSMKERGLLERQAFVVPNGIDLGRLIRHTKTRQEMRNSFHVADEEVLCLQYAWEPYLKGVDITTGAMEYLLRYGLQVKLCLVGQAALFRFVRKRFKDRIPNWVRILEPENEVTNVLKAADIFVSASRTEGFSYGVAEAMAVGLPVISSDIRGLEWAKEAPGVVFFPSEDCAGLAQGIIKIMKWAPEQLAARTAAGQSLIMQRYGVETWAEQVANLYAQIVENKGRRTDAPY
ncbi:MAG TPA: hypothetical protein DCZ10_14125 [Pelotomaculum sp.]|nr:hypothetical protein [Pelotomaculum sp.]